MKKFIINVCASILLVGFMLGASLVLVVIGICDGMATIWGRE